MQGGQAPLAALHGFQTLQYLAPHQRCLRHVPVSWSPTIAPLRTSHTCRVGARVWQHQRGMRREVGGSLRVLPADRVMTWVWCPWEKHGLEKERWRACFVFLLWGSHSNVREKIVTYIHHGASSRHSWALLGAPDCSARAQCVTIALRGNTHLPCGDSKWWRGRQTKGSSTLFSDFYPSHRAGKRPQATWLCPKPCCCGQRRYGRCHTLGMETGCWCDVLIGISAVLVTHGTTSSRDFTPHFIPARNHSSFCIRHL